jgi:hypothetical protein
MFCSSLKYLHDFYYISCYINIFADVLIRITGAGRCPPSRADSRTAISGCCLTRTLGSDPMSDNSIDMLMAVARVINQLPQPVVYTGGATISLYLDALSARDMRSTLVYPMGSRLKSSRSPIYSHPRLKLSAVAVAINSTLVKTLRILLPSSMVVRI